MGLPRKKVLISLHGIRTRGEWQKELCPLVSEKGWKYYPLDYGYFSAAQLAIGVCHNKKIVWFRNRVNQIYSENPGTIPSIIVHSFGSLILAKALLRYEDLKFDKVVLTGSIIPVNFPWRKVANNGQVSFVRNIVGKNDIWPKIANYLPFAGAGNSGTISFNNVSCDDIIEDIVYEQFDHGDAHFPDVFKARVVPFLEDQSIRTNAPKANYLTYAEPFNAACWTVVMYVRQFIERFYKSIQNNDFYYRESGSQLESSPKGFVIVVPESPSGASSQARSDFEEEFGLKPISFSLKARGAAISKGLLFKYRIVIE